MATKVVWRGDRDVSRNMQVYGERVKALAMQVAQYFAPIIESEAKQNGSWVDRTGNARAGLHGLAVDLSETVVAIYLYGAMNYQVFLELKNSGRYQIIMPTLEAHYEPVMHMLREALK